jgi:hypothetical protein
VAFVVHRSTKRNVLDFKAVDDSMCILRTKAKFLNLRFINIHAPTEKKEGKEKEAFYQEVEEVCDTCSIMIYYWAGGGGS